MSFILGTLMAIMRDDEILLINRTKYPFVGFWGIPGGKVKPGETMEKCAVREAKEETGLDVGFHSFRGSVSAKIMEDQNVLSQFMLLLCRLEPRNGKLKVSEEGDLRWFKLNELDEIKEKIIPDDLH
ncbi:NUDIX domain-containing protein, partial [Candidatus Aenigmatarchaeota archaeon]